MQQAETKMGTPVRETKGICVLRTESVCAAVAFFTLNSPYMLKKFWKNSKVSLLVRLVFPSCHNFEAAL